MTPTGMAEKWHPKNHEVSLGLDVPRSTNVTPENARCFFESSFTWVFPSMCACPSSGIWVIGCNWVFRISIGIESCGECHRRPTENRMLNHGFSEGPHMISHDLDTVCI